MNVCVCGTTDVEVLGTKHDRTVGRCISCKLVRTLDPPDDYEQLYTEGDHYHIERIGHIPYRDRFLHDVKVAQQRWGKLMGRFRVLDIGCANGGFVAHAAACGAIVEGVEINPAMAAWAREETGCVIHQSLDDVSGMFDLVTLHDVIEHFRYPDLVVQRIREFVRIGGQLVVDTPDAEDPRFLSDNMNWVHMKPVEHLWFFTEESLRRLLSHEAFQIEWVDRPIPGKIVAYARRTTADFFLNRKLPSKTDPAAKL